jgi:hypothetical protein
VAVDSVEMMEIKQLHDVAILSELVVTNTNITVMGIMTNRHIKRNFQ